MDDRRTGPSTLVDLRPVSYVRRLQQGREQRRYRVHADRFRRPLFRAWSAVSGSGRSRDQSRTRRRSRIGQAVRRPARGARGAIGMIPTWYGIAAFMLIVYVALDGRNFGAGMLHGLVARTPEERRQVIAAIGPLWSWHEVWLVGFGGTVLAVFPKLLASAFAGYYLALFLILWCLILRGISLEVGGHINDRMWQGFWDFVFVVANALLAILFGAAAGNMARGVPLASDGTFSMAFFTDFTTRGYVGLLDWYTVSVALFAAVALAAHGATYLTLKTQGAVHDRSARYSRALWASVVPLLLVISVESGIVRPDLLGHAMHNPLWWLGLIVICGAAIALA